MIRKLTYQELLAGETQAAKLLNTAVELFLEQGFHGTSLADLAARFGIHKSSIYHYIERKEDLLFACVKAGNEWALEKALGVMGSPSAQEEFERLVRIHLELIFERPDLNWVQAHEARHLDEDDWRQIIKVRDRYEEMFKQTLSRGIAEGVFNSELDAGAVTKLLIGCLNMVPAWFRVGGTLSIDQLVDQCVTLYLNGLLVEDR